MASSSCPVLLTGTAELTTWKFVDVMFTPYCFKRSSCHLHLMTFFLELEAEGTVDLPSSSSKVLQLTPAKSSGQLSEQSEVRLTQNSPRYFLNIVSES
ncbi:hypothetical protein F2P81_000935 [Scophthalmus maximus]|uniref:Uncharacterized protein n=1 Tax=Scophthalmus maximus TaxID=52904 RepID=A0A6A4TZ37_SCOMX|nr:hypothetical protein F2P81_000935 [Scophthalmus maximus]